MYICVFFGWNLPVGYALKISVKIEYVNPWCQPYEGGVPLKIWKNGTVCILA